MTLSDLIIQDLWAGVKPKPFKPNPNQEKAILHTDGPLFLTAGPGSGKTRVLLWRTLNLIVFHNIQPEEIFLSTFTEKAAFQLKEGLRSLLGLVTNLTGVPYDLSKMYVGTVHSLCRKLIADRRFSNGRHRPASLALQDSLSQYFYISRSRYWKAATASAKFSENANETITEFFNGTPSSSKHVAVSHCISLFNRLSEECVDPIVARERTNDEVLQALINLYDYYKKSLTLPNGGLQVDFALLQQKALEMLEHSPASNNVFKHVIIDEYQDTNTIQERLFFKLASGHQNLCVVGDDDQALYRFRGATVENFVQFPERCQHYLQTEAQAIPLDINYRSRKQIVDFYTNFISRCNWYRNTSGSEQYRIANKNIKPDSQDAQPSVIASTAKKPDAACAEVAEFVKQLIDEQKVQDPNQIAFLFPSLKSTQVARMKAALEELGLKVYAPRAGRFLEVEEAVSVFGIYLNIFGKPAKGNFLGADYKEFHNWMNNCYQDAEQHLQKDKLLATYVNECQQQIKTIINDYHILLKVVEQNHWDLNQPYDINRMKRSLYCVNGLSEKAKKSISSTFFERLVEKRIQESKPFSLSYIINKATSLDWSVLDLFYRLCLFDRFKTMFDLAERGEDEGPICNLGLITQYLARFINEYSGILTADFLSEDKFQLTFFMRFLYSLFRLGESEYEDAEDPFPKGRIPFLTVHQSKGLEFPIVVLGNPRKDDKGPQPLEEIVRPLLDREGEPLERMSEFDIMRMFYVALSRAKNLLVIAHFRGQGQKLNEPFKTMLDKEFLRIPDFDLSTLPAAKPEADKLTRNYSYTSDYLLYQKCPRQYMIFRKYGFVASRSQTQFFGTLVHKTIEDLHYLLISRRTQQ